MREVQTDSTAHGLPCTFLWVGCLSPSPRRSWWRPDPGGRRPRPTTGRPAASRVSHKLPFPPQKPLLCQAMQVNRRHVDCALAKEGDDVSNGRGQTRPTKASACAIVKIGGGKVARQLEYPGAVVFVCLFAFSMEESLNETTQEEQSTQDSTSTSTRGKVSFYNMSQLFKF